MTARVAKRAVLVWVWIPLASALLLAKPSVGRAQGVQIALTPASQTVAADQEFELEITCTQAGAPFNGFTAVVTFDPEALTLVPASPTSLQEGCLMTGADGCSDACGTTFHQFAAAADSLSITDILLCNQITLVGPGPLYKLRFRAGLTADTTQVQFRTLVVYNGGTIVDTVTTADATIEIIPTVGVGGPGSTIPGLRLTAQPNPARGRVTLTSASDSPGIQVLTVLDVSGRIVRRLSSGWFDRGPRRLVWDGTDAAGNSVRPGIYFVALRSGAQRTQVRVTMLE